VHAEPTTCPANGEPLFPGRTLPSQDRLRDLLRTGLFPRLCGSSRPNSDRILGTYALPSRISKRLAPRHSPPITHGRGARSASSPTWTPGRHPEPHGLVEIVKPAAGRPRETSPSWWREPGATLAPLPALFVAGWQAWWWTSTGDPGPWGPPPRGGASPAPVSDRGRPARRQSRPAPRAPVRRGHHMLVAPAHRGLPGVPASLYPRDRRGGSVLRGETTRASTGSRRSSP